MSEIFIQLHISEKTGRGIPRITSRYGNGVFEFREKSIVVTIPFNRINVHDVKSVSTVQSSGTESNSVEKLSNTQMRILEKLRDNPNIRKVQMASDLGLGKSTIDKGIAELKKAGLIERVGSNKNGYWKVLQF